MNECGATNSPNDAGDSVGVNGSGPRWAVGLGCVAVLLVFVLLARVNLWQPGVHFTADDNAQIAEAAAWWNGHLHLAKRTWDIALKDGRAYSHLPPMFSFIAAGVLAFTPNVPFWFLVLILVPPLLLLSYLLFRLRTGSTVWGAVLAIGFVCGTSLFPVIDKALTHGTPYFINHVLATTGLLLMLIESFGRRRTWIMAVGLVVAALSRQLTLVYILPLVWVAVHGREGKERRRSLTILGAAVLSSCTILGVLNTLKFASPFDSGYLRIYEGREDELAVDARTYGLFSPHYLARNWYYMNAGFPEPYLLELSGETWAFFRPNDKGSGIWWTTPLLLWFFVDLRRIVMDPLRRIWLAAAVLAVVVLLFFHNTGWEQIGFNRFSLDYIPVLLTLVAPRCVASRWRWLSVAMIGWSIVYFRFLI